MRPRLPLALVLLAAACSGDPPLESADGDLVVNPETLEFRRTFVGYPRAASLELANGGRTELRVEARFPTDPGPFSLDTGPLTLAGGDVLALEVRFAPSGPGSFAARVRLDAARGGRTVELRGVAETPPPCDPADPCEKTSFDPETGSCTRTRRAEGEACSTGNPCQVDERCISDVCSGVARDCDDGLNCTNDSCDPQNLPGGCRHEDVTPGCPVPEDPCQVPVCDEVVGCTLAPAPPNTRCGPFTCAAGHVCIEGACTEVDVPDGWPCVAACGDGNCRDKLCVRPEGDVLEESWSYVPAPGVSLDDHLVVDDEGRLYWIEIGPAGPELVSATLDGFVRFRVPLPEAVPGEVAIVGDTAVTLAGRTLQGHAVSNGAERWRRDVVADSGLPEADRVGPLVAGGAGDVRVFVAEATGDVTQLSAYAADTGDPRASWTVGPAPRRDRLPGAVADETGASFVGLEREPAAPAEDAAVELVAVAADGSVRWRRTLSGAAAGVPVAVHDGLLALSSGQALDTADGADRFALPVAALTGSATPVLGTLDGFVVDAATQELVPFDREDGTVASRGPLVEPELANGVEWTTPLLTSKEHALVAVSWFVETTVTFGAHVREFAGDGSVVRTCAVPAAWPASGPPALRGNRLVLPILGELHVFELPKGDTAGVGWTGPWGNAAGGRSAR